MNCGAEVFRLGRFHPRLELDPAAVAVWAGRDVTRLARCRACRLALLCGGGCARLAARRGLDLAHDAVCPPSMTMANVQALVDHYLPRLAARQRRRAATEGAG